MAETLVRMFRDSVASGGPATAYLDKHNGSWRHTSFAEAANRVEKLGSAFLNLGITKGDRVAILSNTRLEWSLIDYALLGAGVVVVPIYQTNSAGECEHILIDSEAVAIIVEDASQLAKVVEIRGTLPHLKHIIAIDMRGIDSPDVISLDSLEATGATVSSDAWRAAGDSVQSGDLATLIYTSGTTGPPKGCMLTHGNYASMTEMVAGDGPDSIGVFVKGDRICLFLPLAHTFARLIHFVSTRANIELAYSTIATLMDDLAEVKPTLLPSVPRVFEKAHTRISGMLAEAHGLKAKIVAWALKVGRKRGKYVEHHRMVPPVLALQFAIAKKLVFGKIHDRFGGNLRLAVSGGAPLSKEVQEFFLAAGIIILEGYGLTESTTAITLNRPSQFRCGAVGPALPDTQIRIADDGEILMTGAQVFQGYYKNPEATDEVITDGWLHTGDIGVYEKGFLYITDRKKDIIVTAGGKNISPQNIEGGLKATQYISQALVYGDKRPFITALITLDPEEIQAFAKSNSLPTDLHELVGNPKVHELVRKAVNHVNDELGRVEQVKRFRILPIDFTQETGELTPTLKLKRKHVCERYQAYIDEMYEENAPDCAGVADRAIDQLQTPVHA